MSARRPGAAATLHVGLAIAAVVAVASWVGGATAPAGRASPAPTVPEHAATAHDGPASQLQAVPDLPEHYLHSLGGVAAPGVFTLPQRLAVNPDGELLLTDAASHRVQVHATGGAFRAAWGAFGNAEGRFSLPDGVAVGDAGRVYVADRANERVQAFDNTGRLLDIWRYYPDPERPERTLPIRPTDVAVAPGGDVLVADWYDNRVLRFDRAGELVGVWGGSGTENGRFVGLTGLDVDSGGRVYTVEWGTDRVQVFDLDGALLDVWHPGNSMDVAAGNGHVYVAGGKRFGVRWLDETGTVVGEIPLSAAGEPDRPGALWSARSVAVGAAGSLYVLEANAAGTPDRVMRFAPDGSYAGEWSGGDPSAGLIQPADVAVDSGGRVLVADPTHGQVQRFHSDGRHESTWAGGGDPRYRLQEPVAIAASSHGAVYVSDRAARRVLELDDSGRVHAVIGAGDGGAPGEFGEAGPGDLAFTHIASSQPGLLYVADAGNTRVQAFDGQGVARLQFGTVGDGPGEFCAGCVGFIDTAPGGTVFVTERSALQRVMAFSWSGEHLFSFEGHVGEDSRFAPLAGIAFGPPDRLYLADPRMLIQAFTTEGRHVGDWDTNQARVGTRIQPSGVAADSGGRVYVADANGGMVHVFGRTPRADWRIELFDNAWVAGAPAAVERADQAELDWGTGAPGPGLPEDGSSARLTGQLVFPPGRSRLEVEVEGGCRVWVGNDLVIDEWLPQSTTHSHEFEVAPDDPRLVVEFVDVFGPARLVVRVAGGATTPTPPTPGASSTPTTPGTPAVTGSPPTPTDWPGSPASAAHLPRLDAHR